MKHQFLTFLLLPLACLLFFAPQGARAQIGTVENQPSNISAVQSENTMSDIITKKAVLQIYSVLERFVKRIVADPETKKGLESALTSIKGIIEVSPKGGLKLMYHFCVNDLEGFIGVKTIAEAAKHLGARGGFDVTKPLF